MESEKDKEKPLTRVLKFTYKTKGHQCENQLGELHYEKKLIMIWIQVSKIQFNCLGNTLWCNSYLIKLMVR